MKASGGFNEKFITALERDFTRYEVTHAILSGAQDSVEIIDKNLGGYKTAGFLYHIALEEGRIPREVAPEWLKTPQEISNKIYSTNSEAGKAAALLPGALKSTVHAYTKTLSCDNQSSLKYRLQQLNSFSQYLGKKQFSNKSMSEGVKVGNEFVQEEIKRLSSVNDKAKAFWDEYRKSENTPEALGKVLMQMSGVTQQDESLAETKAAVEDLLGNDSLTGVSDNISANKELQEAPDELGLELQAKISEGLEFVGAIASMTGNKALDSIAKGGMAAVLIYNAASTLLSGAVVGLSVLGPIGIIAGAAHTIFSLFKSGNNPGIPDPLMAKLDRISAQIENIHQDIIEGFEQCYQSQLQLLSVTRQGFTHLESVLKYDVKMLSQQVSKRLDTLTAVCNQIRDLLVQLNVKLKVDHGPEALNVTLRDVGQVITNRHSPEIENKVPKTAEMLYRWATELSQSNELTGKAGFELVKKDKNCINQQVNVFIDPSSVSNLSLSTAFLAQYAAEIFECEKKDELSASLDTYVNIPLWCSSVAAYLLLLNQYPGCFPDPRKTENYLQEIYDIGDKNLKLFDYLQASPTVFCEIVERYIEALEALKKRYLTLLTDQLEVDNVEGEIVFPRVDKLTSISGRSFEKELPIKKMKDDIVKNGGDNLNPQLWLMTTAEKYGYGEVKALYSYYLAINPAFHPGPQPCGRVSGDVYGAYVYNWENGGKAVQGQIHDGTALFVVKYVWGNAPGVADGDTVFELNYSQTHGQYTNYTSRDRGVASKWRVKAAKELEVYRVAAGSWPDIKNPNAEPTTECAHYKKMDIDVGRRWPVAECKSLVVKPFLEQLSKALLTHPAFMSHVITSDNQHCVASRVAVFDKLKNEDDLLNTLKAHNKLFEAYRLLVGAFRDDVALPTTASLLGLSGETNFSNWCDEAIENMKSVLADTLARLAPNEEGMLPPPDHELSRQLKRTLFLLAVYRLENNSVVEDREFFENYSKPGEIIGEGNQGFVYKYPYRGVAVAVKYFNKIKNVSPIQAERFYSELSVLRALPSDHLVKIICGDVSHGKVSHGKVSLVMVSLVMEYMPGGTLNDVLSGDAEFLWGSRVNYACQVAQGLEVLHRNNISHGDIKSFNVLLCEKGRLAKLTDYSFSVLENHQDGTGCSTSSGQQAYTIAWADMPTRIKLSGSKLGDKERLRYRKCMDVYGFGVLMWELASRKQPLSELGGGVALLAAIIKNIATGGSRDNMEEIPTEISPKYAELIRFCWQNDCEKRPTADSLIKELQNPGMCP